MKLNKPEFDNKELKLVKEVLDVGLLTRGNKVREFEKKLADYVGIKHAIAVSSGASALQLALQAIGVGSKDEVIMPDFGSPSTINALLHLNAKPVLVDVNLNTLNVDVNLIEEKITSKTKAILAVDLFGLSADMEKIRQIAKKHKLKVVEDAAAALGAKYNDKFCGSLADIAVYSFYASRIITTGEGGMVVTNDEKLAKKVRMLSNQGVIVNKDYEVDFIEVGYDFRLTEIQAAIGIAQMDKLENIRIKRNNLAREYTKLLYEIPFLSPAVEPVGYFSTYQPYVIKLDVNIDRQKIIQILIEREIATKIPAFSLRNEKIYKLEGKYPVSNYASKHALALPLYTQMDYDYIYHVCDVLSKFVR